MGNIVFEPTGLGPTKTNMVLVYSDAYICDGNLRYYLHRILKKKKNGNQEYILKFRLKDFHIIDSIAYH